MTTARNNALFKSTSNGAPKKLQINLSYMPVDSIMNELENLKNNVKFDLLLSNDYGYGQFDVSLDKTHVSTSSLM